MEKIYIIVCSLTRQPENNLQEDLAKLLSGDHRFLLKESDIDRYRESVNARIWQVNEKK